MTKTSTEKVYFIGIGGIGMSALARYFKHQGWLVAGYDRTPSPLTEKLQSEGIDILFEDNPALIPLSFREERDLQVIYTPAIPSDSLILNWFKVREFKLKKRAEVLGELSRGLRTIAVAGTHGKTSISTMAACFNHIIRGEGSALLGGISKNFNSNLLLGSGECLVVEADEYDRSFLHLHPEVAVISAIDPDHLDIYGTGEELVKSFDQFAQQVKGSLIVKYGISLPTPHPNCFTYSLDDPTADYYASNITLIDRGMHSFDIHTPTDTIKDCILGVPGHINIENCIAAIALIDQSIELERKLNRECLAKSEMCSGERDGGEKGKADYAEKICGERQEICEEAINKTCGKERVKTGETATAESDNQLYEKSVSKFDIQKVHEAICGEAINRTYAKESVKTGETATAESDNQLNEKSVSKFDIQKVHEAIRSYKGVARRFDLHLNTPKRVYMDDYAHHPVELRAMISSMREMFPDRHLTVIFQPHLFSRTKDFYREFAESLSLADKVLLLPIYPARELPIEGVDSQLIFDLINCPKELIEKSELIAHLTASAELDLVVSAGAGDIDRLVSEIEQIMKQL